MPSRLVQRLLLPGLLLLSLLAAAATPAFASTDPDSTDVWVRSPGVSSTAWVRSFDFLGPLMLAGAETGGAFSSAVPGVWTQDNGGLTTVGAQTVHQIKASPSGIVYAATSDGLFSSSTGTGGWTQVGGGTGPRKLNMGGIQSIVFNDPSGMDMTVAVAGAGGPGVYYTSDGGADWDKASGMPDGENIYYMADGISPTPTYAAGDDGVFVSPDLGRHWHLLSDGVSPGEPTLRVAVNPTNPANLWATTASTVYASTNAGVTWSEAAGSGDYELPAGGKRALLVLPSATYGANRAFVATEDGVYGTLDNGKRWGPMSPTTVASAASDSISQHIVWALSLTPTAPTLVAGTQNWGIYNIPLKPITSSVTPSITPSTNIKAGTQLSIVNNDPANQKYMGFNGTRPYFFTYQWQRCTGSASCTNFTNLPNQTGPTYTVPDGDASQTVRYRVQVTGSNLIAPSAVTASSAGVGGAIPALSSSVPSMPSNNSSITGSSSTPTVGVTETINHGTWSATGATISHYAYEWFRCHSSTCTLISTATGASYVLTTDDIGDDIQGWVAGVNTAVSPSLQGGWMFADTVNTVQNTFPQVSIDPTSKKPTLPQIVGNPYVGQTLSSTAGHWDGFNISYTRRWMRCGDDGLDCTPIYPDATDSTYTVTDADLGSELQLEVTASAADVSQNRVTVADSATTPVITDPPPPVVDPGSGGSGGSSGSGGTTGGGSGGSTGGGASGGGGTPGAGTPGPGSTPSTPQNTFSVPITLPKKIKVGATASVPKSVKGYKKIAYQWLRNGKKITHATKRTYKLTKSDRGKTISCRITLTPAKGAKVIYSTTPFTVPK